MGSTVTATADTRDEHARAIFDLGVQAGLQLAAQRAKLTQLAATVCVLPGCVADHERDDCCRTALLAVGPASTGITFDPQRGWSLQMDLGRDPELLDLDETARYVSNLNRQFRHMLTLAGAR